MIYEQRRFSPIVQGSTYKDLRGKSAEYIAQGVVRRAMP